MNITSRDFFHEQELSTEDLKEKLRLSEDNRVILQRLIEGLNTTNNNLSIKQGQLYSENRNLKSQITGLQISLGNCGNQNTISSNIQLLQEVESLKSDIENLEGENFYLREQNEIISELQKEILEIEAERLRLSEENINLQEQVEEIEFTIASLQEQIEILKSDYSGSASETNVLRANIVSLNDKIRMLILAKQSLESKIESFEKDKSALQEETKQYKEQAHLINLGNPKRISGDRVQSSYYLPYTDYSEHAIKYEYAGKIFVFTPLNNDDFVIYRQEEGHHNIIFQLKNDKPIRFLPHVSSALSAKLGSQILRMPSLLNPRLEVDKTAQYLVLKKVIDQIKDTYRL